MNHSKYTLYCIQYSWHIDYILYICSTKIALIIELMTTIEENKEKILFKDYFEGLNTPTKNEIRDSIVPAHMGYTTFYAKLRNNSWKELEYQELERITGQIFIR